MPNRKLSSSSPSPQPSPTRGEGEEHDLRCPLCDYSLRGLTEPRCPECGYRFAWQELIDEKRTKHPWLFEHHRKSNIWSFTRTILAGLRPRRFWTSVNASHRVVALRLAIYWLVVAVIAFGGGWGGRYVVNAISHWSSNVRMRQAWVNARLDPFYTEYRQNAGGIPGLQRLAAKCFPVPPSRAFFREVGWAGDPLSAQVTIALIAWPWLSLLTMLIFLRSMKRARLRPSHVLRCVTYSFDVALWFAPALLMAAFWTWFDPDSVQPVTIVVAAALLSIGSFRLYRAYQLYLRFDHAVATVIATQLIVLFGVACALDDVIYEIVSRW